MKDQKFEKLSFSNIQNIKLSLVNNFEPDFKIFPLYEEEHEYDDAFEIGEYATSME